VEKLTTSGRLLEGKDADKEFTTSTSTWSDWLVKPSTLNTIRLVPSALQIVKYPFLPTLVESSHDSTQDSIVLPSLSSCEK
jgi:hypothetical protein